MTEIPVVFMANDRFAAWALPFLRSFRATNPATPLWCIPYADDLTQLRAAADIFAFRFLEADYAAIDSFAAAHFPKDPYKRHRLRKLAAFDLGRFLYLDCDALVLRPLAPALAAAEDAAPAGLVYFSRSPEWVYAAAAGPEAAARFGAVPRFSTGAFLAHGVGLAAGGWLDALEAASGLWRRLRAPWVVDQPAINLVCHHRGIALTDFDTVVPGVTGHGFAADPALVWDPEAGLTRRDRTVLWVHWAGLAKGDPAARAAASLGALAARFGAPVGDG